jgi:glycosyltransferase involved in cell wall biosynthesis
MYCGSCIRDNALARAMISQGHDVTLLPLYTPTRPDEENVSDRHIFFGGISVYLEQMLPLFRRTPRWLDWLWDSTFALKLASKGSVSNQSADLAPLTLSMLRGEDGNQRKEFDKLLDWLVTQPRPDIVTLSYTLLIALAGPVKRALNCPVVCYMQGEDLFLDGLGPAKAEAIALIRQHAQDVDAFLAVSEYYAGYMVQYMGLPSEKISVTPLGISLDGYEDAQWPRDHAFTVGYFARVAREKGLHILCEAYRIMRQEMELPPSRLLAAGYLGHESHAYLQEIRDQMRDWKLDAEFEYQGELDRSDKLRFYTQLHVFSTPAVYHEPKGLSVLEAMVSGVPVVLPSHGAFPEIVRNTGGGLLCAPDDPFDLARQIMTIYHDPIYGAEMGQAGAAGARLHYSAARSAERTIEALEKLCAKVAS